MNMFSNFFGGKKENNKDSNENLSDNEKDAISNADSVKKEFENLSKEEIVARMNAIDKIDHDTKIDILRADGREDSLIKHILKDDKKRWEDPNHNSSSKDAMLNEFVYNTINKKYGDQDFLEKINIAQNKLDHSESANKGYEKDLSNKVYAMDTNEVERMAQFLDIDKADHTPDRLKDMVIGKMDSDDRNARDIFNQYDVFKSEMDSNTFNKYEKSSGGRFKVSLEGMYDAGKYLLSDSVRGALRTFSFNLKSTDNKTDALNKWTKNLSNVGFYGSLVAFGVASGGASIIPMLGAKAGFGAAFGSLNTISKSGKNKKAIEEMVSRAKEKKNTSKLDTASAVVGAIAAVYFGVDKVGDVSEAVSSLGLSPESSDLLNEFSGSTANASEVVSSDKNFYDAGQFDNVSRVTENANTQDVMQDADLEVSGDATVTNMELDQDIKDFYVDMPDASEYLDKYPDSEMMIDWLEDVENNTVLIEGGTNLTEIAINSDVDFSSDAFMENGLGVLTDFDKNTDYPNLFDEHGEMDVNYKNALIFAFNNEIGNTILDPDLIYAGENMYMPPEGWVPEDSEFVQKYFDNVDGFANTNMYGAGIVGTGVGFSLPENSPSQSNIPDNSIDSDISETPLKNDVTDNILEPESSDSQEDFTEDTSKIPEWIVESDVIETDNGALEIKVNPDNADEIIIENPETGEVIGDAIPIEKVENLEHLPEALKDMGDNADNPEDLRKTIETIAPMVSENGVTAGQDGHQAENIDKGLSSINKAEGISSHESPVTDSAERVDVTDNGTEVVTKLAPETVKITAGGGGDFDGQRPGEVKSEIFRDHKDNNIKVTVTDPDTGSTKDVDGTAKEVGYSGMKDVNTDLEQQQVQEDVNDEISKSADISYEKLQEAVDKTDSIIEENKTDIENLESENLSDNITVGETVRNNEVIEFKEDKIDKLEDFKNDDTSVKTESDLKYKDMNSQEAFDDLESINSSTESGVKISTEVNQPVVENTQEETTNVEESTEPTPEAPVEEVQEAIDKAEPVVENTQEETTIDDSKEKDKLNDLMEQALKNLGNK